MTKLFWLTVVDFASSSLGFAISILPFHGELSIAFRYCTIASAR